MRAVGRDKNGSCAVAEPSITFVGDVALPAGLPARVVGLGSVSLRNVVVNLEGAIATEDERNRGGGRRKLFSLYSSPEVLDALREWGVQVASLANNHITDFGRSPRKTIERLAGYGIGACGAGDGFEEARKPASVVMGGRRVVFLSFGWPTIECVPAAPDRAGVNPLWPRHVLGSVAEARRHWPDGLVVVLVHWNFEGERYPLPMDRQLAFEAVLAGADAVIGHHPHCVQGVEFFRGAPIVYSLGNWFLPQGSWFGGVLRYPEYVLDELAFEWRPASEDSVCHWFRYDPVSHGVVYQASASVGEDCRVAQLTPFAGMSHREYVRWFRSNRTKRRGLPVYADFRQGIRNAMLDRWVALRQWGIVGLRGGLRLGG